MNRATTLLSKTLAIMVLAAVTIAGASCKKEDSIASVRQYLGTYTGSGYTGENWPGMGADAIFNDMIVVTSDTNNNEIVITMSAHSPFLEQTTIHATVNGNNITFPVQTINGRSVGKWSGTGSLSGGVLNYNISCGIPYIGFNGRKQ